MHKNNIVAVLFDLDGTLLDTARDLGEALNHLLTQENLPPIPYAKYREQVSNGGNALISLGFGTQVGDPRHQSLYQALLQRYGEYIAVHTKLFPGMEAVLGELARRGIPWGVVTNKPRQFTHALLERTPLQPPHQVVVCPEDVQHRKPHPESLLLACKQLAVAPQQALYVGDHQRDIECGRSAGLRTVAARYGYIAKDDDPAAWAADYYIDAPLELIALLEQTQRDQD